MQAHAVPLPVGIAKKGSLSSILRAAVINGLRVLCAGSIPLLASSLRKSYLRGLLMKALIARCVFLLVLLLVPLSAHPAQARTWHVNNQGRIVTRVTGQAFRG